MGATLGELCANMNRLKGKIWSQMEEMEADLVKDPFPESSLRKKLENMETDWSKAKDCHDDFFDDFFFGLTSTKDDHRAYEVFQAHYLELSGWTKEALEDYRVEEQAKEAALKEVLAKEADLKEEQVQKAVRKKVVMVGQRILACERGILAKAGAEAAEKAELVNSGKETSAG